MSSPLTAPDKAIQFLVSPQRDFIGRIRTSDGKPPNSLHIGPNGVSKLRGDPKNGAQDALVETVRRIITTKLPSGEPIQVVLDEDWHNANCPEFAVFGRHCVKGTDGAALVGDLGELRWEDNVHVIRANSINIASDPQYSKTLDELCGSTPPDRIHVGIIGVWTNIKVEYLAVNLMTLPPCFAPERVGICEPLTAAPEKSWHDSAIDKLKMMGCQVFQDIPSYLRWMGISN
jgi:nicotinamidase-related amidase